MKVLMVNGSPRQNGNTARALKEIADTLKAEGIDSEVVWIGVKPVRGCVACGQCREKGLGRCAFDDDVANRIVEKLPEADGIFSPSGSACASRRRSSSSASPPRTWRSAGAAVRPPPSRR